MRLLRARVSQSTARRVTATARADARGSALRTPARSAVEIRVTVLETERGGRNLRTEEFVQHVGYNTVSHMAQRILIVFDPDSWRKVKT